MEEDETIDGKKEKEHGHISLMIFFTLHSLRVI